MDVTSQKDSAQGIQQEWDMTEAVYRDGTLQTHSPTKSLQRALWNDHKDLKPQAQSVSPCLGPWLPGPGHVTEPGGLSQQQLSSLPPRRTLS